jgi:hypothetical protein
MVQHVTAHHLTRLACLYVRQSTLQQVLYQIRLIRDQMAACFPFC